MATATAISLAMAIAIGSATASASVASLRTLQVVSLMLRALQIWLLLTVVVLHI